MLANANGCKDIKRLVVVGYISSPIPVKCFLDIYVQNQPK
jgi:hypothetical protein